MLSRRSGLKAWTGQADVGSRATGCARATPRGLSMTRTRETKAGLTWAVLLLGAVFQLGCNGSAGKGVNSAGNAITTRDTEVKHEACDVAAASEKIDANGDGKPDISVVKKD